MCRSSVTQHPLTALRALQAASCLLYTSDAADERSSVDLGGRRIIKKKKQDYDRGPDTEQTTKVQHDRQQQIADMIQD